MYTHFFCFQLLPNKIRYLRSFLFVDPVKVREYKEYVMQREPDGQRVMKTLVENLRKKAKELGIKWPRLLEGPVEGGQLTRRFSAHKNYLTDRVLPVVLVKVPVVYAGQITELIPAWGKGRPDIQAIEAVTDDWSQRFLALPAIITEDLIEFSAPAGRENEKAVRNAAFHALAINPELLQVGGENILGALTDSMMRSDIWQLSWENEDED